MPCSSRQRTREDSVSRGGGRVACWAGSTARVARGVPTEPPEAGWGCVRGEEGCRGE